MHLNLILFFRTKTIKQNKDKVTDDIYIDILLMGVLINSIFLQEYNKLKKFRTYYLRYLI